MPETAPAAARTRRPDLAGRLCLALLPLIFLALWAGLLWFLGRILGQLAPAALTLDPAALLLWLTLGPMTVHLAQALFYLPRKASRPPVFLGLRESPLTFLPLAGPGRLEAGPAFFAAARPGDQARILAAAEARLKQGSRAGRLGLLLESRNPLDLALRALARQPWPLAAPARLILLLTSPTRQLTRLCGFLFFRADQAWADHRPMEALARYKRRLAWDIWRRARTLDPPTAEEDEAAQVRRLTRLRVRLAGLHQNPGYGTMFGEPWPEAETEEPDGPEKIWLAPRYRGAFANLPVTLYAKSPVWLYAPGRPEKDLGLFYPMELALEAEDAALLAGEGEFLASLMSDQAEDGLVRLDGRLQPAWNLAAELSAVEEQYNGHLKRIFAHHARTRAAHLAEAKALGRGWPEALRDWGAALWLAEHGRWALTRAREELQALAPEAAPFGPAEFFPSYAPALAPVSPNSFPRDSAEKFHAVWADLRDRLADLDLPTPADLEPPTKPNWPKWQAAWPTAWARLDRALAQLRDRALTGLLTAEDQVAKGQADPAPALPAAPITSDFPTPPDRPQPPRVYYPSARFKVGPARSALAALVLTLLLWQGWYQGLSLVTIHNGLPAAVTVNADGRAVTVAPFGHRTIRLRPGGEYEFTAALGGQTLETFRQRLGSRPAKEIYNVAGAAPLMEWWYPRDERPGGSLELFLGRPRWLVTRATVIFKEPAVGRRALVLSGYGNASPEEMLAPFADPAERMELARLHARHTPSADPRFQDWLTFLPEEERAALLLERLPQDQAGTARTPAAAPGGPPPEFPDGETEAYPTPQD